MYNVTNICILLANFLIIVQIRSKMKQLLALVITIHGASGDLGCQLAILGVVLLGIYTTGLMDLAVFGKPILSLLLLLLHIIKHFPD